MKIVSKEYRDSMRSILRNRSYVEIIFDNVDTSAVTDGRWEANESSPYSEVETLDYDLVREETYASLELNRWALDGTGIIVPDSEPYRDGYISPDMSNENGILSSTPILVREFSDPHSLIGITLEFDVVCNEWPQTVTAVFYRNGKQVLSKSEAVKAVKLEISNTASEVDKVELSLSGALPYRRLRLQRTMWGMAKVFDGSTVISTKQSNDVDPLSRRLPNESFQFTILDYEHNYDPDNPSGVYQYIDERAPITIRHGYQLPGGTIEWLKGDKYVLNSKPSTGDGQATFKGTGLINSLTSKFHKSKLGSKNLYDMAEEVLLDAGLDLGPDGGNPWAIDESLKSMFTTAALPIATHMNCLQLIAHAARCRLYTDDDNVIHISPFGVTVAGIYSGPWSDNGHTPYSEWNTVDQGNVLNNTYATLELNRWELDGGDQIIIPASPSGRGFVGSEMAGTDGTFLVPPVFTKTFDQPHDMRVMNIQFDNILDEYPRSIQVKYYNEEGGLLDTQTVYNISSSTVSVASEAALGCKKFEVTATDGLPGWRMRVTKVFYRETDFTLNFTTIKEKSQKVSKIDALKAVTVAKYAYVASNDTQTLYEETTTKTELHVEFSGLAQNVQINVSGGTVISSAVYARAADLVLSSGTKTVTITGKTLSENSVVVSFPVASTGETDVEENPLITNDEMCNALAEHVIKYLKMRNTYDVTYRGNPELETGDVIGLQTRFTPEIDALVLVDEITFNGSLSGKVKVKGLI